MDSLQFQKLELPDARPKCAACQNIIENSYFHFAGKPICPTCAEITRVSQKRPGTGDVTRGLLYGLGAAVACSVGYAVITRASGMEFSLISILVGYLVGRAVRIGSRGLGGLRCQILAVALTYLAITTSYIPLLIKGAQESAKADQAKNPTPAPTPRPRTPGTVVLAWVVIAAIAVASPFLALADGVGGLLGIAIIAFGLMQAWKQTRRDPRLLMGPYQLPAAQAVEGPALG